VNDFSYLVIFALFTVASKRPRNQTPHAYAACCVGVTLHRMLVAGNTLEVSSCRTRRRLRAKYRLRQTQASASRRWTMGRTRPQGAGLGFVSVTIKGQSIDPGPSFPPLPPSLEDSRRWSTASVRSEAEPRTRTAAWSLTSEAMRSLPSRPSPPPVCFCKNNKRMIIGCRPPSFPLH
jgi:hypothetical protein